MRRNGGKGEKNQGPGKNLADCVPKIRLLAGNRESRK